jgi:hypothetical protein
MKYTFGSKYEEMRGKKNICLVQKRRGEIL